MRRLVTRFISILFVLMMLDASIQGQESTTVHGQIVDEVGAVIPGARVTLTAPNGKKSTATTGSNGEFSITGVAVGIYTLSVEFPGFQNYFEEGVKIPASKPLKVTMIIAPVNIETEVKEEAGGLSVEPDQNLSAIVLDEDFIMTLPDNEDDLLDFLTALAGPGAGGSDGGQGAAQIFIDGFNGGRLPPREAILQIKINQNPFSAEFSRPGNGRVEIITKPGTEQWHGSFGFSLRNSALDARNAFAITKPDLSQTRFSWNLSGPIIDKKMSFFAFVERRMIDGSSPVNAETLNGIFNENVAANSSDFSMGFRSGYLINDRNTINFGYNYSKEERFNREFIPRFGSGGGGGIYTLPERGSDENEYNHTISLTHTLIINSQLVHEARARLQFEKEETIARTPGLAIDVLDAFNGGGSTCCPNSSKEFELDFQDYLTYTYKRHTIRGGLQFEYESMRDLNASNFNGTYTFSSLDQYQRALEDNSNGLLFRPTQFTINQGDPDLRFSQYEASWFVQDDIRFRQNFTLSIGLRHEFQSNLKDKFNLAPRIGVAWSPFKNRKTTIRAGIGAFYNRLNSNLYANTLRFDGSRQQSLIIRNPIFCPNYPADIETCNPILDNDEVTIRNSVKRVLDPNLKAPYTINITSSIEHQFPWGIFGSLTHTYTRGIHFFRTRNINAPLPETGLRPVPAEGNIFQLESTANSVYHGFSFRLDRRFSRQLSIFSNYNLSWTKSDADGAQSLPWNNYDLRSEWGRAFSDRRHYLVIGGNISLPYDFRIAPFITASSGSPFNITTGFDENFDTTINDRPAGISRNSDLPAGLYPLVPLRCVLNCLPGMTPVSMREYLETYYPDGIRAENPGAFNVNLNISKTFGFGRRPSATDRNASMGGDRSQPGADSRGPDIGRGGRGDGRGRGGGGGFGGGRGGGRGGGGGQGSNESARFNFTISAQITNLFNHVNFGRYSGVITSPFFNRSNSSGGARQFEFNFRFRF